MSEGLNKEKHAILKRKPDVVYIGFPRAGSTFLRSYFSNHPDIEWTRTPDYFGSTDKFYSEKCLYYDPDADVIADEINNKCLIDMYEGHAVGYIWNDSKLEELEDKVTYIKREMESAFDWDYYYPGPTEIASRIKTTIPQAKILIVLRNQEEWLISMYKYNIMVLPGKNKSFHDFIRTRLGKCVLFSALYHNTLETYYNLFGKENVHVLLLEQIRNERNDTLKKLSQFLGVDFVELPEHKERLNKGVGDRFATGITRAAKCGIGISKSNVKRWRQLVRLLGRINSREKLLDKKECEFIRSFYAASNFRLSRLLGIDLSAYGYPV